MFHDLLLNNGQTAKYLYLDNFDRPVYQLESGRKVCCVDLDGTNLHTMSSEGEPDSPLINDYHPVNLSTSLQGLGTSIEISPNMTMAVSQNLLAPLFVTAYKCSKDISDDDYCGSTEEEFIGNNQLIECIRQCGIDPYGGGVEDAFIKATSVEISSTVIYWALYTMGLHKTKHDIYLVADFKPKSLKCSNVEIIISKADETIEPFVASKTDTGQMRIKICRSKLTQYRLLSPKKHKGIPTKHNSVVKKIIKLATLLANHNPNLTLNILSKVLNDDFAYAFKEIMPETEPVYVRDESDLCHYITGFTNGFHKRVIRGEVSHTSIFYQDTYYDAETYGVSKFEELEGAKPQKKKS